MISGRRGMLLPTRWWREQGSIRTLKCTDKPVWPYDEVPSSPELLKKKLSHFGTSGQVWTDSLLLQWNAGPLGPVKMKTQSGTTMSKKTRPGLKNHKLYCRLLISNMAFMGKTEPDIPKKVSAAMMTENERTQFNRENCVPFYEWATVGLLFWPSISQRMTHQRQRGWLCWRIWLTAKVIMTLLTPFVKLRHEINRRYLKVSPHFSCWSHLSPEHWWKWNFAIAQSTSGSSSILQDSFFTYDVQYAVLSCSKQGVSGFQWLW